MDWSILTPEVSVVEKIVRPLIIYFFLLIAFRLAGKRELGQMTRFDLIVLLTISNVLQNAMIGSDNSLGGGIIGALTLFATNAIVTRLSFEFPIFDRLFEPKPTLLVENGRILTHNLRREVMTRDELARAIRTHDLDPVTDMHVIKRALLESDGSVTIERVEGSEEDRKARKRRHKPNLPQMS